MEIRASRDLETTYKGQREKYMKQPTKMEKSHIGHRNQDTMAAAEKGHCGDFDIQFSKGEITINGGEVDDATMVTSWVVCQRPAVMATISQPGRLRAFCAMVYRSLLKALEMSPCDNDNSIESDYDNPEKDSDCENSLPKYTEVPVILSIDETTSSISIRTYNDIIDKAKAVLLQQLDLEIEAVRSQGQWLPYEGANVLVKAGMEVDDLDLQENEQILLVFATDRKATAADREQDLAKLQGIIQKEGAKWLPRAHAGNLLGTVKYLTEQEAMNSELPHAYMTTISVSRPQPRLNHYYLFTFYSQHITSLTFHFEDILEIYIHKSIKIKGVNVTLRKTKDGCIVDLSNIDQTKVNVDDIIAGVKDHLKFKYGLSAWAEKTYKSLENCQADVRTLRSNIYAVLKNTGGRLVTKCTENRRTSNRMAQNMSEASNLTAQITLDARDDKNEQEAAEIMIKLQTTKSLKFSYSAKLVQVTVVRGVVYPVVAEGIEVLRQSVREKFGDNITIEDVHKGNSVHVTVYTEYSHRNKAGPVVRVLRKITSPLEMNVSAGHMSFLNGPVGACVKRDVERHHNVRVYLRGATMQVFGEPNCARDAATRLSQMGDKFPSVPRLNLQHYGNSYRVIATLRRSFGYGLQGLRRAARGFVAVDPVGQLCLFGKCDVKQVQRLVDRALEELPRSTKGHALEGTKRGAACEGHPADGNGLLNTSIDQEASSDCVVCWSPAQQPVVLGLCGHTYCMQCLRDQLAVTRETRSFPVTCLQEGCGTAILLRDLRPHCDLDKLLGAAVGVYVNQHCDVLRFCPTPGCQMVYGVGTHNPEIKRHKTSSIPTESTSKDVSKVTCPSCSQDFCSRCHVPYHEGMLCITHQVANTDIPKDLRTWMVEDETGKRRLCPRCGNAVEKESGCNNVPCISCKYFLCWVCNDYFQNGNDCYIHLEKLHGGAY